MNIYTGNLSKAKDAIAKFHNGSYPDMVKNSVLLLNYLHQHSFISRPIYSDVFEQKSPSYFAVACIVNNERTVGNANSKKAARTQAADKMLNVLLNTADYMSDNDVRENLVQSGYDSSDISPRFHSDEAMNQNFCDGNVEERISCQMPMDTTPPSQSFYSPSSNVIFTQPQWSGEVMAGNDYDGILLPKTVTDCEEQKRTSFVIQNNTSVSIDDYFDPYFHLKKHSSQSSNASHTSSDVENIKPCNNVAENGVSENLVDAQTNQSKSGTNTRHRKETKRVKLSNNPYAYILDSYFDPFFKLKPISRNQVEKNHLRSNVNDNSMKVNEVRVETEKIKSDKTNTNVTDMPKLEKTKSPFAILQEKSIKNFKLIPRCSIERCDDGFKCKLVLDSYSSEGVGQSKKLAKINAAIVLLQLLEEHL